MVSGNLRFGRRASELRGQIARHRVQLLLALAQIARCPIELPQAVEDRALDAVLGVALENNFLVWIVLGRRVKQSQHAGMDQIIQIHVNRKVLVHANRDCFHQ